MLVSKDGNYIIHDIDTFDDLCIIAEGSGIDTRNIKNNYPKFTICDNLMVPIVQILNRNGYFCESACQGSLSIIDIDSNIKNVKVSKIKKPYIKFRIDNCPTNIFSKDNIKHWTLAKEKGGEFIRLILDIEFGDEIDTNDYKSHYTLNSKIYGYIIELYSYISNCILIDRNTIYNGIANCPFNCNIDESKFIFDITDWNNKVKDIKDSKTFTNYEIIKSNGFSYLIGIIENCKDDTYTVTKRVIAFTCNKVSM